MILYKKKKKKKKKKKNHSKPPLGYSTYTQTKTKRLLKKHSTETQDNTPLPLPHTHLSPEKIPHPLHPRDKGTYIYGAPARAGVARGWQPRRRRRSMSPGGSERTSQTARRHRAGQNTHALARARPTQPAGDIYIYIDKAAPARDEATPVAATAAAAASAVVV